MYQFILCMFSIFTPVPGKMTPELNRMMSQIPPDELITVIVHMNADYPYDQLDHLNAADRGTVMKAIAANSQREIIEYLSNLPPEKAVAGGQYWIFNGFHLKATRDAISALARRNDVWFISENNEILLQPGAPTGPCPAAAEWNIQKVMADSCWQAGYSGESVILGFVDTGFMTTHEALAGKWLSPYWLDAINGQNTPYDDNGHGTAVAGVACGGDGPGPFANDIGVAYGAKVIPTKAFSSGGSGTYQTIDSCLQYLADLRISGVAIRAINNSWGSGATTDQHWWNIMLNLKTIGVLPSCAVGGSGPGAGTVCVPANYPTVIGIGATDASDNIASFSGRGPAPDQLPWTDTAYWYYPSWNLLKPDVSAPGVNIRTSYNNGGYINMSGASFSAPHVTGGVALFCDKDSLLSAAELYYLFRAYCDQPPGGAPYPNMNYGWGRINLWRGMQALEGAEETDPRVKKRMEMAVYPTISRGRFNIMYSIGQRAKGIEIHIYDISGCLIRSMTFSPMSSAPCIVWNGSDDRGRRVAPGVYLVKLTAGEKEIVRKAVVIR